MPPLVLGLVLLSAVLHASWNLIARQRASDIFVRTSIVIGIVGLGPALIAEFIDKPILPIVWMILPFAGLFQAIYYVGLARGYGSGDFTIVYPLARALPVLLVAVSDLVRGHPPSAIGWLGLILVSVGCVVIPLESVRGIAIARYWNPTTLWAMVAALGTYGYTITDSAAAQEMPEGPLVAMRYLVYELTLGLVAYWLILKIMRERIPYKADWRRPAIAAFFIFASYGLILWAFQLTPYASYVVGLRQFSIVLGAAVGAFAFREPAPALRISAAAVILSGIVCIALTK